MNAIQMKYLAAKEILAAVDAEIAQRLDAHKSLLNSDNWSDVERYCDIEAEAAESMNRNAISMALVAAEDALLDWAYETMMRLHPERADVLRLTLGNDTVTGRRHLGHRTAMLDTASRLAV